MELFLIALMLLGGVLLAGAVLVAIAIATRQRESSVGAGGQQFDSETIASSILVYILLLAGKSERDAFEILRSLLGTTGPVAREIELVSWAERFAGSRSVVERQRLLDLAVQAALSGGVHIPLPLYSALLDLSFALGFRTDALALLQEKYKFDYVDFAKAGRPAGAEQRMTSEPFFDRRQERRRLLIVLGLEDSADRQAIARTYRRLAVLHHPDRYFNATDADKEAASRRFIELTAAYEKLLNMGDDR